jgi:hypothetical protein
MFAVPTLVQLQDVFAVMGWIAGQATRLGIDDQIEHFQGNLADEYRHFVEDFHHVDRAEPVSDC